MQPKQFWRITNNPQMFLSAPRQCYLLNSNFTEIWKWHKIQTGDVLIVLAELDIGSSVAIGEIDYWPESVGGVVNAAADFSSIDPHEYDSKVSQAKEEFRATGKIKGFEVLHLSTMRKLWVSHYDMTIFSKIDE
jgi:hypothetical protein